MLLFPPPILSITPGKDYIFSKLVWNMFNWLVELAEGGGESTRIRFFHPNYCREINFLFYFDHCRAESRDFNPNITVSKFCSEETPIRVVTGMQNRNFTKKRETYCLIKIQQTIELDIINFITLNLSDNKSKYT